MSDVSDTSLREESTGAGQGIAPWPSPAVRGYLWLAFAVLWMIALLVPIPLKAQEEPRWGEPFFTFSKLLHIGSYGFFTLLTAWLLVQRSSYRYLLLAAVAAHALLSEYLQYCLQNISGRTGKWSDFFLDCVGIVLGVVVTWKWWQGRAAPSGRTTCPLSPEYRGEGLKASGGV